MGPPKGPPIVICMVGLPAAGKSRLTRHIAQGHPFYRDFSPILTIDTDFIRARAFGFDFSAENEAHVIEQKRHALQAALGSHRLVIVDDLHYLTSMRQAVRESTRNAGGVYCSLYVNTPPEVCLAWNRRRGESVPSAVIHKIAQNFDPPGKKYAWDTPTWEFHPETDSEAHFLAQVHADLENGDVGEHFDISPPPSRGQKATQETDPPPLAQALDLSVRQLFHRILRHSLPEAQWKRILAIIGNRLPAGGPPTAADLAPHINATKRRFIRYLIDKKQTGATVDNFLGFLEGAL